MKHMNLLIVLNLVSMTILVAQRPQPSARQHSDISSLIDQYAQAREKRDTVLLKKILTDDIDQLVSSGEWRTGIRSAVQGMLMSSARSPGTRTLTVDRLKLLNSSSAVVDCRYEIKNANDSVRNMWSSFIVVFVDGQWRISAIRNMLPAGQ